MHPATRLLPICTLALLPISLAAQDAPYRIYRDARVPLSIDNTRIAVRALSTTTTNRLVEAARSLGIPASSVDPAGAPTWFFLNLIDPLLATDDVRRAVARLSKHASIGFAAPALHGIDGHWATITPDILMQFRELPEDPLRVVRAKSRLESAGISPFGGLTRAFVVRHSSKDGFAVLDAANRLAEDPGVAWAEPDWQFSGQGTLTPNDPGWAHLWGMHNTGQFSGVAGMDMDADLGKGTGMGMGIVLSSL